MAIVPLCDPRIELYPTSFWEDYVRLSNGPRGAGDELMKRRFYHVLLDIETQAGLVRELKREKWDVVAHNGSTVLMQWPSHIWIDEPSDSMDTAT